MATVKVKINAAKEELTQIYEEKGLTDKEVLMAADRVDRLLNIYGKLVKKTEEERVG